MSDSSLGIIAALGDPLFLTFGFIIWDSTWKGSAFALNLFKCLLGSSMFLILSILSRLDAPLNSSTFEITNVSWLVLSGFIGIIIGDSVWIEAMRILRARRVMMVDTLKPFLGALLGKYILDENLNVWAFVGITVTMIGVLVTSLESDGAVADAEEEQGVGGGTEKEMEGLYPEKTKENGDMIVIVEEEAEEAEHAFTKSDETIPSTPTSSTPTSSTPSTQITIKSKTCITPYVKGYLLAATNVAFDAYGSVLTKQWGGNMTTFEINLIRFGSSGVILAICSLCMRIRHEVTRRARGQVKRDDDDDGDEVKSTKSSPGVRGIGIGIEQWYEMPLMSNMAWFRISLGVFFVTFLCTALRNYAVFQIPLALSVTLSSVGPIFSLPMVYLMKGEVVSKKGICFTFVAVLGILIMTVFGLS